MAKNVYSALNEQLLDEIPKLCHLAYKLIDSCLIEIVRLQIHFLRDSSQVHCATLLIS